ncbi:hypothetical protein M405DRAFT_840873 [Rhizopogon salebrosus TDB-379]|nr:hypothetical protein M405DRAFT_840873 [Rhizopogon salebrosus TDB-379]
MIPAVSDPLFHRLCQLFSSFFCLFPPTFNSLDDAKAVLEAAMKYHMGEALIRAGHLVVVRPLSTKSLELYALSCRSGWKHHAQIATAQTLEIRYLGRSDSNEFAGMRVITALDYRRLLVYYHKCGVATQAVGESLTWLEPSSNSIQMVQALAAGVRVLGIGRSKLPLSEILYIIGQLKKVLAMVRLEVD